MSALCFDDVLSVSEYVTDEEARMKARNFCGVVVVVLAILTSIKAFAHL